MAKKHLVRALKTIKHMEGDESPDGAHLDWSVPGTKSAVFLCSSERLEVLRSQRAVVVLDDSAPTAEIPADAPPAPAGVGATGELPEDFPWRDLLVRHGLNTVDAVADFPDLTVLDGIGPARAEAILEALAEMGVLEVEE